MVHGQVLGSAGRTGPWITPCPSLGGEEKQRDLLGDAGPVTSWVRIPPSVLLQVHLV